MFPLLFIPERDLSLFERDGLQNFGGGGNFLVKKSFSFPSLFYLVLSFTSDAVPRKWERDESSCSSCFPFVLFLVHIQSLSLSLCRFVGTGRCRLGSLQIDDSGRSAICCRHEFCASVRTCAFLFDIFLPFLFTAATIAAPIAVGWWRWATLSDGGLWKFYQMKWSKQCVPCVYVRTCVSH